MVTELLKQIDSYLLGQITLQYFEEWLVNYLQDILNSADKKAIELANRIDADLVEFGEGLMDESAIRDYLQKYLMDNQTEFIKYGPTQEEKAFSTTSSTSTTVKARSTITLVEDHRFQAEFA